MNGRSETQPRGGESVEPAGVGDAGKRPESYRRLVPTVEADKVRTHDDPILGEPIPQTAGVVRGGEAVRGSYVARPVGVRRSPQQLHELAFAQGGYGDLHRGERGAGLGQHVRETRECLGMLLSLPGERPLTPKRAPGNCGQPGLGWARYRHYRKVAQPRHRASLELAP